MCAAALCLCGSPFEEPQFERNVDGARGRGPNVSPRALTVVGVKGEWTAMRWEVC